jgi:hypothetical protein
MVSGMQVSTAIAVFLGPIVSAAFSWLFLKPLTGYLQRRIKGERLRRILFKRMLG